MIWLAILVLSLVCLALYAGLGHLAREVRLLDEWATRVAKDNTYSVQIRYLQAQSADIRRTLDAHGETIGQQDQAIEQLDDITQALSRLDIMHAETITRLQSELDKLLSGKQYHVPTRRDN